MAPNVIIYWTVSLVTLVAEKTLTFEWRLLGLPPPEAERAKITFMLTVFCYNINMVVHIGMLESSFQQANLLLICAAERIFLLDRNATTL